MIFDLFACHHIDDYLQQVTESESRYLGRIAQEHHFIVNEKIYGTFKECSKRKNIRKSRSPDIKCWDITRVPLATGKKIPDFIHANYVHGFDYMRKFIVTQEPMDITLNDYWTMVWQENTRVIVMLNGAEIASDGNDLSLIGFNIIPTNIILHDSYVETIINVYNAQAEQLRTVHHFKYLDWPKEGITDVQKFLDFLIVVNRKQQWFINEALAGRQPLPSSIIVYSSTGTGRAATFCAVDVCIHQIVKTKSVSVPTVALQIRQQRHSSLKSLDQYTFINNVVVYFLATAPANYELFCELRSQFNDQDAHLFSKLPKVQQPAVQ